MTEKTVEELTVELDSIKRRNMEYELAEEKKKEKKTMDELALQARNQLKEEIKAEMGYTQKSKLEETSEKQSMNLTGNKELENFKANWIKTRELKEGVKVQGLSYIDIMENLTHGAYAKVK